MPRDSISTGISGRTLRMPVAMHRPFYLFEHGEQTWPFCDFLLVSDRKR